MSLALSVSARNEGSLERARILAEELGLPILPPGSKAVDQAAIDALLVVDGETLSLQQTGRGGPGPVVADFGGGGMRHRRKGGQNELLGRAIGVGKKSPMSIIDATAGLGRDSFVLADLGCRVLLCERNAVIAALLSFGIQAARVGGDTWLQEVMERMSLFPKDARSLSVERIAAADVIYLDPMFPERRKSAAVKKEMVMFQSLLLDSSEDDGVDLLRWAEAQDIARIVVKRPLKAPPLGGRAPSHSVRGKAVRFDVYVFRGLAA